MTTPPLELESTCKICQRSVLLQRLDANGKYWQCPVCQGLHEDPEIRFYYYK